MKSNFDFLQDDIDTEKYLKTAQDAERAYTVGAFDQTLFSVRKVSEDLVKVILDRSYVDVNDRNTFFENISLIKRKNLAEQDIVKLLNKMRNKGNSAVHSFKGNSKSDALERLKDLKYVLVWFFNRYAGTHENNDFFEPQMIYQTAERKLIYVQTADNSSGKLPLYDGLEKVGDATVEDFEINNSPNSEDLRTAADNRIRRYMTTAGVPYILQWAELAYSKKTKKWFRDYDVHDVLTRSGVKKNELTAGNEWFKTDLETVKAAIAAVKDGRASLELQPAQQPKIVLRPEQEDAIAKTKKAFKKYDTMLWNAKMRFGKTLSALQLIKEMKYKHVLLMTHRPVVKDSWFDDFKKIGLAAESYVYGSREKGESLSNLAQGKKPFIYFASIQDLRGSEIFGGRVSDKNRSIADIKWDLVIIDEAHEGTQTELAQNVIKGVVTDKYTKLLNLSGTPFNLIEQYDEEQVYTWDYVMEQKAKYEWDEKHPKEANPYLVLPKVTMYTFDIGKDFRQDNYQDIYSSSFNFAEFFKTDDDGQFIHKADVNQFLNNITTPDDKNNYPFSKAEFRDRLRHTLWIMPSRKAAKAMKKLMDIHPVFGSFYKVINIVDENDNIGTENDLDRVRSAIGEDPTATRTITLTVRKLTTGVNVPQWTGVIFLSNTNSAMQYLQAAFRAQTPYSHEKMGMKTNCYIFDFAPDRALTVMAESSQLNTGVGKRTTSEQKEKMKDLLNFLPVIGMTGHGMAEFKVDTLLAKIKRVYAEKAVRTGFDDESLYSDELLMLDKVDITEFSKLKAIVGVTKEEKKPLKVVINNQGLTDEEYEKGTKAQKKPKKKRTPEEEAAIEKIKELKKQRKTMISILRSISIRIPMMIYGMDIKLKDDVDIRKFVELVDDISWKEFMPKGVTKELFKKFIKYYDADVFLEAGRIIRRKAKALDELDPLDRVDSLADIFATFRNPDKETVLTPWRVVNMHLGKTIGGLSFYDEDYQSRTVDGVSANHWIKTDYTDAVFNSDAHILEINSKTGLYPLYATASLYYREFAKLNEQTAGKFSFEDQLLIWQKVLRENIFVIAKTPMAQAITKRTLAGYRDFEVNADCIEDIIGSAQKSIKDTVKKIRKEFNNMKFDVVIGNPPYQDETKGDNSTFAPPVYNLFMDLSYKLADLTTLITPARFLFKAGSTPKDWNEKILNDEHFKIVMYEAVSGNIFPKTDIKGGVAITLRDKNQEFGSISEKYAPVGMFIPFNELNSVMHKVTKGGFTSFSDIVYPRNLCRFTDKMHEEHPDAIDRLSKGHAYDVSSNIFDRLEDLFFDKIPNDGHKYIQLFGLKDKKRCFKYVRSDYIKNQINLDKYKVFVPNVNGSGAIGEVLSTPLIGLPLIGCTETFISIGAFDDKFEAEAVFKYIKTKFARAMLGIKKATQHNTKSTWQMVPMQDFTEKSDIDWTRSVHEIDLQLYKKYNLSEDEISFIESKVQAMD